MTPSITYKVDGDDYVVFAQKNGCDHCHKTGDDERKVYYFKDGKGPFDKPPVNFNDWI